MRKTLLAAMALCSMSAVAQTDELDIPMRVMRPECIENYELDGTGTRSGMHKVGKPGEHFALKGSPKIPILLVEFPDRPFCAAGKTKEEVIANYEVFFNSLDDKEAKQKVKSYGSVALFFKEMSRGQFTPEFEIIGPIMLSQGYAYYGYDSETSKDKKVSELYKEALTKSISELKVDWSRFDNNGDGKVDFVHFVHSGWGQNVVADFDKDAIWAKEMPTGQKVTLDDGSSLRFACFAISAEARYVNYSKLVADAKGDFAPTGYNPDNLQIDGVGVCLHEFSHALGLPDLYDYEGKAYGMDTWSIMDYGEYCSNGYAPVNYTAYERNFMGWEELPVLSEPQVLTLKCFADGGIGYKVVNPGNENEYYVLENRQPKGWESTFGKRGHGLLVTHVVYDSSLWTGNRVNTLGTSKYMHMTVIPSSGKVLGTADTNDGNAWMEAIGGVAYPGNTMNYNLTDESLPAATVHTANNGAYFMSQPIRNISENADGTITLCFRTNGQLEVPEVNEASDIDMDSFTASWETVENATQYAIEMVVEGSEAKCDTLTETSITYADLQPNVAVKYRVMALADTPEDYVSSEWSEYVYLTTDADLISDVPEGEQQVVVYAMNGMIVSQCYADELSRLSTRPGVYVVKYANGRTRKVVLR